MSNNKIAWQEVNLKLPQAQAAFKEVQRIQADLKRAKAKLEKMLMPKAKEIAGDDFTPIFAYRFGKISMGFKPIEDDQPKAGKNAIEL